MQKARKALHFIMRILKKVNKNTKSLAYTSLVCAIVEYEAACCDPYSECQINALDRVQKIAARFAHHTSGFSLGISGTAQEDTTNVCTLQSVYW